MKAFKYFAYFGIFFLSCYVHSQEYNEYSLYYFKDTKSDKLTQYKGLFGFSLDGTARIIVWGRNYETHVSEIVNWELTNERTIRFKFSNDDIYSSEFKIKSKKLVNVTQLKRFNCDQLKYKKKLNSDLMRIFLTGRAYNSHSQIHADTIVCLTPLSRMPFAQ
jgi:hypothetical protein